MRLKIAGMLAAAVLGAGCASSGRQVVQPEYQEKLQGRPTLGVLPLGAHLMAERASTAPNPLTRRGRDLFYRLFGLTLNDLSNVTVLEAGRTYASDSGAFAYRRLTLPKSDTVEVPVPVAGPVPIEGRNPAFLLLIDDLRFAYGSEEGREALGTLVTERLVMVATCEYVLWDNRAQRLVGYGRLEATAPTEAGANVRVPISLLLHRLGASILRKSPFVLIGVDTDR